MCIPVSLKAAGAAWGGLECILVDGGSQLQFGAKESGELTLARRAWGGRLKSSKKKTPRWESAALSLQLHI